MNRAIARRPLFESPRDIRFFLACVARAVRRGQIEVHAWCVLTTHFHLLVRSPRGELSDAMRRIQNEYVRHFNRTRRRDGALMRGRFRSKPVDSLRYRQVLVRYIDANAVQAGLCADPAHYPWCSARRYASGPGPRWLNREWVEGWITAESGTDRYDPSHYPPPLDSRARARIASLVAARLENERGRDDLDSLLGMATPATLAWLRRKATLADGQPSGPPYAATSSVTDAVTALARQTGDWRLSANGRAIDGWSVLHAGLLQDLARARLAEVARRIGVSHTHAGRLAERHRRLIAEDEHYGRVAARTAREILHDTFAIDRQPPESVG